MTIREEIAAEALRAGVDAYDTQQVSEGHAIKLHNACHVSIRSALDGAVKRLPDIRPEVGKHGEQFIAGLYEYRRLVVEMLSEEGKGDGA